MPHNKSFYITTTLPYVNAEPHIGFAMEIIHADIVARAKELQDYEVFFNTGTDEHGMKIYQKAFDFDKSPQEYVDAAVVKFKDLKKLLNLSSDIHFVRTTDPHHIFAAQEFWKQCDANGYIYKKKYKAKYCVGCELERTDSEIENGKCFIHQDKDLEIIEEENYFFKFSAFQKPLLKFYKKNPDFVIPSSRFNEVIRFVESGLEDFSISRLKSKMSWGVTVPGDDRHVMYVWFDALVNYISTIGWPDNKDEFDKWWPVVQFAGKDQVRQQAAMWQAMLMSVGLVPSQQIVIHGFVNFGGQKMSKSLGNVISPNKVLSRFNLDTLRYFVTREFNQFEDTDISWEKFLESYNANLANGLGNLVARIMKLAETYLSKPVTVQHSVLNKEVVDFLDKFEIQKAANHIWEQIGELDAEIQESKPWESKDKEIIGGLVVKLAHIGYSLTPFIPQTSEKILKAIKENKMPETLFPRKDA
ncbi:MAG: hypothetical protein A3G05_00790 [Candidatus Zambryskibacteria bacterium RIFCSPLOWO2_12_FULL_45_14]|uniref:methionine--tRNA ligase n=2 Tax=Candidatus Zambryskiibacteriota TaxID=1817925 RepID=A0A1G2UJP7_9BACT|nr:MAG: hypothetical protein A3H60_00460 [Candidatus Zambryskibacteria bacterium RIFCSPLOWO2_02_FULL_44_12b]OHB13773.1 MAG: hypothetical protein A3G05_00790 [Candidatus Zambryskibacteria bacterium RIFCSPLOWO2_12_FULL_45_14]